MTPSDLFNMEPDAEHQAEPEQPARGTEYAVSPEQMQSCVRCKRCDRWVVFIPSTKAPPPGAERKTLCLSLKSRRKDPDQHAYLLTSHFADCPYADTLRRS